MQPIEAGPARRAAVHGKATEDDFDKFSKQDADTLLEQGQHILDLPAESIADAWSRWASEVDVRLNTDIIGQHRIIDHCIGRERAYGGRVASILGA